MYKYGKGGGDEKKEQGRICVYNGRVRMCSDNEKKKLLGHFVMSAEGKTMKSKVGTNQLPTN